MFYRTAVLAMICKRRFPSRRTRGTFGASVISSVIALAESENRNEQTAADDKTRNRQFADTMRVVPKVPVFVGFSEDGGKTPCLPAKQIRRLHGTRTHLTTMRCEFQLAGWIFASSDQGRRFSSTNRFHIRQVSSRAIGPSARQ